MNNDISIRNRIPSNLIVMSALILMVLSVSCSGYLPGFRWMGQDGSSLAFSGRARLKTGNLAVFGKSHPQDVFSLKRTYIPAGPATLAIRVHSESGEVTIALGWTGKNRKEPDLSRFSLGPGWTTCFLRLDTATDIRSLVIKLEVAEGEVPENAARIESVAFQPWFSGYDRTADGLFISDGIGLQRHEDGRSEWTLNPPSGGKGETLSIRYVLSPGAELTAKTGEGSSLRLGKVPGPRTIRIPLGLFMSSGTNGKISVTVPDSAGLESLNIQTLPAEDAALIDPGLLLISRQPDSDGDFSWYRWDLRPDVLLLAFKNY